MRIGKKLSDISKIDKLIYLTILIFSIFLVILGYYILNHSSQLNADEPNNTFDIVFGCVLMAVPFLLWVILIKKLFFTRSIKKRKKLNPVFLEKTEKSENIDILVK